MEHNRFITENQELSREVVKSRSELRDVAERKNSVIETSPEKARRRS